MGYYIDCIFVRRDGFSYYCSLLDDNSGYYVHIEKKGSCDHFSAISTKENSGYKGSDSCCFLTSACVEYMGKADDCEELTKLRKFRDEVLSKDE